MILWLQAGRILQLEVFGIPFDIVNELHKEEQAQFAVCWKTAPAPTRTPAWNPETIYLIS